MVTIIQSTATLVQGGGLSNSTVQLQSGGPTNANTIVQGGAPSTLTQIVTPGGFSSFNEVVQFEGVSNSNDMISASPFFTAELKEIVFLSTFSGSTAFFGVIGTSGTAEKFFDRSSFFFTPSETDPNTVRDISEVEPFLLFSQTHLFGEEAVKNTPSSTALISDKGTDFDTTALQPKDLVVNGSFERGLISWLVEKGQTEDVAVDVTSQPTGVGFDDGNPVTPVDGIRMLHTGKASTTSGILSVKQIMRPGKLDSEQLRNFEFSVVSDDPSSSDKQSVVSLAFFLNNQRQHAIQYKLTAHGLPSPLPDEIAFPSTSVNLGGAVEDVFNTFNREIVKDISFTTFAFDEVQLWLVSDSVTGSTDLLYDDLSLTIDDKPEHLKVTDSFAHINTNAPVTSGIPFTISGSDTINQIDLTAPFLDETAPASGTTFNVPDTQVEFHVKDGGSALDQGTINMFIDGLQVVSAGTTVTGTLWPIASKSVLAPNNIQYIFTRGQDFLQQSVVVVSGSAADMATPANGMDDSYQFTILGSGSLNATISGALDATPPVITPLDPIPGQSQVSPDTSILWTTTDNASGVDPSTIKLLLNGGTRVDGGTVTEGALVRVANSNRGFDETYTPDEPFPFGSTVTGTIEADDVSGNSTSLTYEFTITPDNTLEITNFFLNQNESATLSSGTEMSVCVEDPLYGVNTSGTSLTINGVVPSGLVTAISGTPVSGTGSSKVTFSVLLEPLVDFREDLTVFVHAENNFPGTFPVIKEQTFVLRPGYSVEWHNKTEDQDGGPETVFSYITNVEVLTDVKNFAKNFGEASAFLKFLTEEQAFVDLGASLTSNIEVADLSATLTSLNPFFVYGKTMTLKIEADDLEGNQLRLTHTFTIEPKPT